MRRPPLFGLGLAFVLLGSTVVAAPKLQLELRHVSLDLPGPPAKIVPFDYDADGRRDLAVVVAYTEVRTTGEERMEDLVVVTEVVPVAFDRRELRLYRMTEEGEYTLSQTVELPFAVHSLEPWGPEGGFLMVTDDGVDVLVYRTDGDEAGWRFENRIRDRSLLAGTDSFLPGLEVVHDLDGDGAEDVLFPASDALAVYLTRGGRLRAKAAQRIEMPAPWPGKPLERFYPLPEVRDLDGDGRPELVFHRDPLAKTAPESGTYVLRGAENGIFLPLRSEPLDCGDTGTQLRFAGGEETPAIVGIVDVDRDGRMEVVLEESRGRGDSLRKMLKDAKRPLRTLSFHRLRDDFTVEPTPFRSADVVGHGISSAREDFADVLPANLEQFLDLDGDGDLDLVTLTFDFSLFQVVKVLATKKIALGLTFHPYCQDEDGVFRKVRGTALSQKLKFDLARLSLGRFGQFAGDFDGDGRQDFVRLGREKRIRIHRGQPGCRYPKKPDLVIELEAAPERLELVRVEDLDGDGRSDLRITRPLPQEDPDATPPVRLDLYLSGSPR